METKKKRSIHFWIKQSRHLICFLLVLLFVFVYGINAFADGTLSDYVDFNSRYGIVQGTTTANLTLYNSSMSAVYTADGNNASNLSWTGFYNTSTQYSTVMGSYLLGSSNWATKWTRSNITYDFTNAYTMIGYNSSVTSTGATVVQVLGSGNICLIDRTIVSDAPFSIFIMFINQNNGTWGTYDASGIFSASSLSANGYYCLDMYGGSSYPQTLKRMGNVAFTDMNIYLPSSDGVSGFTNFSLSSTDFSFDGDNYNFNYLKTGNYISSPNDPEDIGSSYIDYAKSKMNFSMTSYYTGGKLLNNAKHDVSIIWPEVVKQSPENFYVVCDYTGRYKDDALASTITFEREVLHGTTEKWIPVTEIMSRSGGKLPSSFDIDVGLNTLVDGNGKSMYRYFLESVSAFSGASVNSVENNSLWYQFLVDVGEAVSNWLGISEAEQPLAKLAQDIDSYIDVMEIDGYVWIAYSDSSDTYATGKNHTTFNFKTGDSTTVGTDNTINQYPEEGQDIYNVPSVGGGGTPSNYNQNAPVAYGGQVVLENNIQALVEYLFHIDTDDLLAMQGNISNTFNTVIGQITDTSDNGFLPLLERTYSYIPEEIWSWIKTAVGAVLLIAVWQAFISNKRIKG